MYGISVLNKAGQVVSSLDNKIDNDFLEQNDSQRFPLLSSLCVHDILTVEQGELEMLALELTRLKDVVSDDSREVAVEKLITFIDVCRNTAGGYLVFNPFVAQ